MKVLLFMMMALNMTAAWSESEILSPEVIDVDGYIKEEQVRDQELLTIQSELKRQKKEIVLNKEKSKQFKVLSKSVEKLSEATEEYLEEKKAAQAEIAEYNIKVKCLQEESTAPECAKYNRRR